MLKIYDTVLQRYLGEYMLMESESIFFRLVTANLFGLWTIYSNSPADWQASGLSSLKTDNGSTLQNS
jgi:hypothetical protein